LLTIFGVAILAANSLLVLFLAASWWERSARDAAREKRIDRLVAGLEARTRTVQEDLEQFKTSIEEGARERLERERDRLMAELDARVSDLKATLASSDALAMKSKMTLSVEPAGRVSAVSEAADEPFVKGDLYQDLEPKIARKAELNRQFGSMKLEPERQAAVEEIFNAHWSKFLEIQRSGNKDIGDQRVSMWQDYCQEIRPYLKPEEALRIGCGPNTVMRPEPGPQKPLIRKFLGKPPPEPARDTEAMESEADREPNNGDQSAKVPEFVDQDNQ